MSTKKISEVFPKRLKASRKMRDLNQAELGRLAGLQSAAISHFETGARKPSFDNLRRLADALEVSIDYLLGRTDEPTGVGKATDRLHRHIEELSESDRQFVENMLKQLAERGRKE